MRLLRLFVSGLFAVVALVFVIVFISETVTTDKTVPVIKIEEKLLDVKPGATDEELLKGVTAFDEKDKDITDKVFVESVSKFVDKGICKVTYAVCDSDNHVAKATRKIRYKGYTSPRFKLKRSTCYSIYETIDVLEDVSAHDVIDGDISKNLIITSENYTGVVAGVYSMNVTVTNSNGDVSTVVLPLIFEDRNLSAPEIELKSYLLYLKQNQKVDFEKYIIKATDRSDRNLTDSVTIESNVNFSKPGTYSVHYYATDVDGLRGHTVLTVVIE